MSLLEWKEIFDDLFEAYPDRWTLNLVHRNDSTLINKLKAKQKMERTGYARFHCPKCSNSWASAKSMVIFYCEKRGTMFYRLFGQQCRKCSQRKILFVYPEFDTDIIENYLQKLFERIGCDFYGKERSIRKQTNIVKENNIKGPHESSLCEACQLGICDQ